MVSLQSSPYALQPDGGDQIRLGTLSIRVLANAQQSGGAFSLFYICCPSGFATPLHIHYSEDVGVYVLQGTLAFFWGDESHPASAGAYFFQPRGMPHGFRVVSEEARLLYFTTPGSFEQFLTACNLIKPHDYLREAARHQIEFLGPLPGEKWR